MLGIFLNHTHDFSKISTLPSTMYSPMLLFSTLVSTVSVPRWRRARLKFNATVKTDAVIHVVGTNPTLIKRCITLAFQPFCRIAIGEPKPIDLRRYPNSHRAWHKCQCFPKLRPNLLLIQSFSNSLFITCCQKSLNEVGFLTVKGESLFLQLCFQFFDC